MPDILAQWCAKQVHDQEARDQLLHTLRHSITYHERFVALIGRGLTVNCSPYLVNRFAGHLFINELTNRQALAFELWGPRLRCGSFPPVGGFTRSEGEKPFAIERFDASVTRTGTTERRVSCHIKWSSAGIVLGSGMGILFTSNYSGNDEGMLTQLPHPSPRGEITINLDLQGLELANCGLSLFVELVQLGGFGLLPHVVSDPVLRVLCV